MYVFFVYICVNVCNYLSLCKNIRAGVSACMSACTCKSNQTCMPKRLPIFLASAQGHGPSIRTLVWAYATPCPSSAWPCYLDTDCCTHAYVYPCMCIHVGMRMLCVRMYVRMYVRTYVCMYVCMCKVYVYIYTCVNVNLHESDIYIYIYADVD